MVATYGLKRRAALGRPSGNPGLAGVCEACEVPENWPMSGTLVGGAQEQGDE